MRKDKNQASPLRERVFFFSPLCQPGVTSLSPTIPAMMSPAQNNRPAVAGSPNKPIPSSTVPTAPIPVQTAYAVPKGRFRKAIPSKKRLAVIDKTVATEGHSFVNPSEYLRPTAQPISNNPARKRISQAMMHPNSEEDLAAKNWS